MCCLGRCTVHVLQSAWTRRIFALSSFLGRPLCSPARSSHYGAFAVVAFTPDSVRFGSAAYDAEKRLAEQARGHQVHRRITTRGRLLGLVRGRLQLKCHASTEILCAKKNTVVFRVGAARLTGRAPRPIGQWCCTTLVARWCFN